MFRVVNDDLSYFRKEILGKYKTLEEALQCEVDNYEFNTSVEQHVGGNWKLVAVNSTVIK